MPHAAEAFSFLPHISDFRNSLLLFYLSVFFWRWLRNASARHFSFLFRTKSCNEQVKFFKKRVGIFLCFYTLFFVF